MPSNHVKPPTFHGIWKKMTSGCRRHAALAFWLLKTRDSDLDAIAIAAIAQRCKLREKKVRSASEQQRANWTVLVDEMPEPVAEQLLFWYLATSESDMLSNFLDSLQIPHNSCFVSPDFDLTTLDSKQISAAAQKLCSSYDRTATDIYFQTLLAQEPSAWSPLQAFTANYHPSLEEFAEKTDVEREMVSPGEENFTTLDDMLTSAIIASAAGVEGALSKDQLDDLIDEVVELNTFRHKTLFHKGFSDVIFGRILEPHGPVENENRRKWYLCGALVAYARRAEHGQIANLYDIEQDVKAFGRELKPRSLKAAQFVFEALCHQGRSSAAAEFLAPEMIVYGNLFDIVMQEGTRALRSSNLDDALGLFELINRSLDYFPETALEEMAESISVLRRRTAHCLRLKRQFGAAKKLLQDLIKNPDAPERSAMLTDIAIMDAGFRGLMDIVIPEKDLTSFVGKLEQIRGKLESALEAPGNRGHAQYCLGVLLVANQKDPGRAAELLEPSVTNILRRGTSYDFGGLLSRSQFYLALALAETLNSSYASRSVDLYSRAIDAGFIPPAHLLKRYLEALLLISSEAAHAAAEHAVRNLKTGRAVLNSLIESDVAVDSEPVLRAVFAWACDESRPGKQRYADLEKVLAHALRSQKLDVAEQALDSMEDLARNGTCSERFIELLSQVENYDPAWSASDAAWSAVAVLESLGKYHEAASLLEREFHVCLSSQEYGSMTEAVDILDRIRTYGLPTEQIHSLESRLNALLACEADSNERPSLEVPVVITVVGGDEMQARYDDPLRKTFGNGTVDLHFRHTNWSSNHGEQFEQMRPLLDRSDAVVVMRRIRTNLGRNVRRHCPVWIGCAGDSKSSVDRAIRKAISAATARKWRARGAGSSDSS